MKRSEIVLEYLRRFPKTPSLSLARKIYKENADFFTSVDQIRTLIRYYRGLHGNKCRKELHNKEFVVKPNSLSDFNLPKSYAEKIQIFSLPEKQDHVLVLSDLHIPYHDVKAIESALQYGKDVGINTIFINGDLVDFFMISRFVKTELKVSVAQELEIANEFLDALGKAFPKTPIYFLMGNHDMRLQKYLATKAPELLDIEEFRLKHLLHAGRRGITVLEEHVLVKMGKLFVTHGHNLLRGFFAPVNAARGAFLRAKSSVLIGHVHKISTHSETTIGGKTITCYSTGSLCELNPKFAPFANNFTHGFAVVRFDGNGEFQVKNIQILDGKLVN